MRRCLGWQALISAALIATACERTTTAPPATRPAAQVTEVAGAQELDLVAQGIAAALNYREVRQAIIKQMRRSPVDDHKVLLQDALAGSKNALRMHAAKATGRNESAFLKLVSSLPQLEFYLSNPQHRRTWTADGGIAHVVASLDGRAFTEYDAAGRKLGELDNQAATNRIIFAVNPAGESAYRIGWNAAAPDGAVIEDPDEPHGGLVITYTGQDGKPAVLDVGKAGMAAKDVPAFLHGHGLWRAGPSRGMAGGITLSSATTISTYLSYFANAWITDNNGLDSAELEFKARKFNNSSNCCEQPALRFTGVWPLDVMVAAPGSGESCGTYAGCLSAYVQLFSGWYPGADQYTKVGAEVVETDTGSDDHYGFQYWDQFASGALREYVGLSMPMCTHSGSYAPCAYAKLQWF